MELEGQAAGMCSLPRLCNTLHALSAGAGMEEETAYQLRGEGAFPWHLSAIGASLTHLKHAPSCCECDRKCGAGSHLSHG
jgi:hypothetical protein